MPRGMNPNSRANLKTNRERTKKERTNIATKGGKASGEARRKKAELKEIAQAWLDAEIKDKNGTVLSGGEALIQFAVEQAAKGDVRAMEFIRDTAGQKPTDNIGLDIKDKPDSEDMQRMLEAMHKEQAKKDERERIIKERYGTANKALTEWEMTAVNMLVKEHLKF